MGAMKVILASIVGLIVMGGITTHATLSTSRSDNFELSIIHLNDFHARFEEMSLSAGACNSDNCIGGFSRVYAAVTELVDEKPNAIFLNAGDNFQGTLWYNMFRWNVTQFFLNLLPTDAITLGNHEFDNKIEGVVPFLEHLKAPVVVSNIDDSLEPAIQGLYQKSTVIERDGRKIGIVGVILSTTNELTSSENLRFLDESESVNQEAQRLLDEEDVFTVIVLSHCGYDVDQQIAAKAIPGITVIVGGHSHTLLYTGTPPDGTAYGTYPTVINNIIGDPVLIVQASSYTRYLGSLSVEYDNSGNLFSWGGNPIYLDKSIPQDSRINDLLEPYRLEVEAAGNQVLGTSKVFLNSYCRYAECNLGNFLTDAMVAYYASESNETWTKAAIGIINAGGIRTSMDIGDITANDLGTSQPFANTIDYGELQGKYIKEFMEKAAMPYSNGRVDADINLMQVSGIRVAMNLSLPLGSRITSLKIRCHACRVPAYYNVDLEAYYPMAVPSFLVTGGDGYTSISDNIRNHEVGPVDTDVYTAYIKQQTPIIAELNERIRIITEEEIRVVYHG
ncbi:hypothetical protein Trydic_g8594 [Trypoxylus dichotomus]